jgi:hypothetical protein
MEEQWEATKILEGSTAWAAQRKQALNKEAREW